ncbi:hypothetical protein ACWD0A_34715 [Streptomyces sp. NPDC002867]
MPQLANGQRRCSIRFKGWVLDNWAAAEFGARTFRRVIGYHADELGRAEKDTAIQRRLNTEAGRTACEPRHPLILARMDRAAVEAYVLASLGEPIKKSYCAMCPFSGVCASRDRHEERLRAHPHVAADVLRLEYVSMALNEQMSLYRPAGSLYGRLTEDGRNRAVLDAFQTGLDQTPYAVYEIRRITFVGRTKDCRRWHGKKCAKPKWWCSWQRTPRCRRIHTIVDEDCAPIDVEPHRSGPDRCRGKQQKGRPGARSARCTKAPGRGPSSSSADSPNAPGELSAWSQAASQASAAPPTRPTPKACPHRSVHRRRVRRSRRSRRRAKVCGGAPFAG